MAISFKVGFMLEDKDLKDGLQSIHKDIENAFNVKGASLTPEIQKATKEAMALEKAMRRATTDKGISYYSLQSELRKAGTSAAQLTSTLAAGGDKFAASLNAANSALALSNRHVISLNAKVQEMARVMLQSFKFTAAQAAIQGISGQVQEAVRWTTDLYDAINQIGIVTGKTGTELEAITQRTIAAAKDLRVAAKEYAQGELIFYQQGLNDAEVARRTEIVTKAAKASGESMAQMSSEMTAIWNNYHMVGEEQARAASVGAKMAAQTAVDFSDIAEAMQTAAAPAAQMGVSYDSLAAIIATVGDTTQQSASVIGNAYKTIFSRFQQLKAEGTDGEVTLNRVSSQLKDLGVNALDSAGNLRPLGDMIHEVGEQWDGWSSKQQLAIAQLVGGTRQYGQFLALMNNFDKYQENLQSAQMEDGSTLEAQYGQYLESIESYAENAGEAWNRAFSQIIDTDALKTSYRIIEEIGNGVGAILNGLGGAPGLLLTIGTILSSKIVPGLIQAGARTKDFVQNLTPEGRQKGINADYDSQSAMIDSQIEKSKGEGTSTLTAELQLQKQKLEVNRQVAIVNEQINTALQSATGAHKINLQYQQQQLALAQQNYQAELDKLAALQEENKKIKPVNEDDVKAQAGKVAAAQQALDLAENREEAARASAKLKVETEKLIELEREYDSLNGNVTQGVQKLTDSLAGFKLGQKNGEQFKKELSGILDQLGKDGVEGLDTFKSQLNEIFKDTENIDSEALHGFINDLRDLPELGNAGASALQNLDAVWNMSQNADTSAEAVNNLKQAIESSGQSAATAKIQYGQIASGMLEIVSCTALVTTAVTNLFSILGNEDMSFGEKLVALVPIITQLVMGIGMMQKAFAATKALIDSATVDSEELAAARREEAEATRAAAKAEEEYNEAKKSGNKKKRKEAKNKKEEKDAELEVKKRKRESIESSKPKGGKITGGKAIGKDLAKKVGKGAGKLVTAVGGKLLKLLPVIGQVVTAISLINGALELVKMVVSDIAARRPEEQLRRQKEASDALSQSLGQAKTEAEDLKQTIEGYRTASKSLDKVTRGTEEFRNALSETNTEAMRVLEVLAQIEGIDLSGLYSRDDNGALQISEEGIQKAEEASNARVNTLELATGISKAQEKRPQAIVSGQQFAEENGLWGDTEKFGLLTDTLVAAAQEGGEALKAKLDVFGINTKATGAELEALANKVQQFGIEQDNAGLLIKESMANFVEGISGDKSDEVKGAMTEYMNRTLGDSGQLYKDTLEKLKGQFNKAFNGSESDTQAVVDAYNRANGTDLKAAKNFAIGTDEDRQFQLQDAEGKIIPVTQEYIASLMAAEAAQSDYANNLTEVSGALKEIEEHEKVKDGSGISEFLSTGQMDQKTSQKQIDDYIAKGTSGIKESLMKAFDVNEAGLEEKAAALGYNSADAMVNAIYEGVTNSKERFENVGKDLQGSAKKGFDELQSSGKIDDLGVGQQEKVANLYQQAAAEEGAAGVAKIKQMFDAIPADKMETVLGKFDEIDWSKMTPEKLISELNAAGIATDGFKGSLESLIDFMNDQEPQDVAKAREDNATLSAAASRLEEGETNFAADDPMLADLENFGYDLDDIFTVLNDGSYQLTVSASELANELRALADAQMQSQMAAAENKVMQMADVMQNQQNYQQQNPGGNYGEYLSSSAITDGNVDWGLAQEQLQALVALGGEYNQEWLDAVDTKKADEEMLNAIQQATQEAVDGAGDLGEKYNDAVAEAEKLRKEVELSHIYEDAKAFGIDPDQVNESAEAIEEMGKAGDESFEHLVGNDTALKRTAKELLKYADAADSVVENMEDWQDVIKRKREGGLIGPEDAEALEDYENAMGGMLDYDPGILSDKFKYNAQTLDLMAQAANGSKEALAQLNAMAQEDIVATMNAKLDPAAQDQLQADLATLNSWAEGAGKDIPFGVGIDPVAEADFYAALNNIVAAATAAGLDAQAVLAAMGYDVELEPVDAEQTETQESHSLDYQTVPKHISGSITFTGSGSIGTGEGEEPLLDVGGSATITQSGQIQGYKALPKTETETTTKQTKGMAMAVVPGSAKKKMGGGVKVGKGTQLRKGGGAPKRGGGGGGGKGGGGKGGGGGGGGGKAAQFKRRNPKKERPRDHRYDKIQKSIDKSVRELKKFNDAAEQAWGGYRIRNMVRVNNELQTQAKNLQNLQKEAKQYLEYDKKMAKGAFAEWKRANKDLSKFKVPEFKFNAEGFVDNFEEVVAPILAEFEKAQNKWYDAAAAYDSAMVGNEAAEENIDKLREEADRWKNLLEIMTEAKENVDESATKVQDAYTDRLENVYTWMENKVKEAEYKLEFRMGFNERDIETFELLIEAWGDLGIKTGKAWNWEKASFDRILDNVKAADINVQRMQEVLNNLNDPAQQQWFKDKFGEDVWQEYLKSGGRMPEQVMKTIEDRVKDYQDFLNDLLGRGEDMMEQFIDLLEMYLDKFDLFAEKIDQNRSKLDTLTEMMEFSGRKWTSSGMSSMRDIYEAQMDSASTTLYNAKAQLDVAKDAYDRIQAEMDDFLAQNNGSTDFGDDHGKAAYYNQLKENVDEAQEAFMEAQDNLEDSFQDLISAAADSMAAMVEIITQETENALDGLFADFESMTELFDQKYGVDHFYLEGWDKDYQLKDLLDEINKSMEDVTDPERLEEYNSLIGEVNSSLEEGVKMTQTDVDLLKAKFEMQQAQDAYEEAKKAKNTMKLARDASGNWNYVYSTDGEQPEDAVDKLAEAEYNYNKLLHSARDEAEQLWIQAQEEFFEWQQEIDYTRLRTDAKYREQIKAQYEYYLTMTEFHTSQVGKYNNMLGDNFKDTTLGIITGFDTVEDAQSHYTEQHEKYNQELIENEKYWQSKVEEACDAVGFDYRELEDEISQATSDILKDNQKLRKDIDLTRAEAQADLKKMVESIHSWRDQYISSINAVISKIKELQALLNTQANKSFYDPTLDYSQLIYDALDAGIIEYGDDTYKALFDQREHKITGENLDKGYYQHRGDEADEIFKNYQGGEATDRTAEQILQIIDRLLGHGALQESIGGLATGGLVSTRGIYELAEDAPEIVLNPEDTRNILSAVQTMREVISGQMNNVSANLNRQISAGVFGQEPSVVQQEVKIEASFPGVSVASEIEEAFNNLVNQAVQYANRIQRK